MKKVFSVYKITNKINGKYYIGVHKTSNPNDDYMGSGKYIKYALSKYGIENFSKEILAIFDVASEAYLLESKLVTWELIESGTVYNIKEGGHGGFDHLNYGACKDKNLKFQPGWCASISPFGRDFTDNLTEDQKAKIRAGAEKGRKTVTEKKVGYMDPEVQKRGRLKAASYESNEKRKETFKEICHQQGIKNSSFGTCWIMNLELKENKKIKREELQLWLEQGWLKGRRCHKEF